MWTLSLATVYYLGLVKLSENDLVRSHVLSPAWSRQAPKAGCPQAELGRALEKALGA